MQIHYGPGECYLYDTIYVEAIEADVFANVLGNDTLLCYGDTLHIAINYTDTIYSFNWSTGDTSAIIKVTDAGNYTLEIEYASGCSLYDTIAVNYTSPLIIESTTTPATGGEPNGSITVNVSGDTAPYTYTWSDGLRGTEPDNLYPALYYLTIIDALGCMESDSVRVEIGTAITNTENAEIYIYPNPFGSEFLIGTIVQFSDITLHALNGNIIPVAYRNIIPGIIQINTEHITPGLYILKLQMQSQNTAYYLVSKC